MKKLLRLLECGWVAIKDCYSDQDTGYGWTLYLASPRGNVFEIPEESVWWDDLMDLYLESECYPVLHEEFDFDPRPFGATWIEIIRPNSTG